MQLVSTSSFQGILSESTTFAIRFSVGHLSLSEMSLCDTNCFTSQLHRSVVLTSLEVRDLSPTLPRTSRNTLMERQSDSVPPLTYTTYTELIQVCQYIKFPFPDTLTNYQQTHLLQNLFPLQMRFARRARPSTLDFQNAQLKRYARLIQVSLSPISFLGDYILTFMSCEN